MQVHDSGCWAEVLRRGSLGLGDTYVAGQWDCAALGQFFTRVLLVQADDRLAQGRPWRLAVHLLRDRLFNLQLEPGMRVLDIGCGWGALAAYLARRHGAEVVGITLWAEQLAVAREHWGPLPLRFELCDYRQLVLSPVQGAFAERPIYRSLRMGACPVNVPAGSVQPEP